MTSDRAVSAERVTTLAVRVRRQEKLGRHSAQRIAVAISKGGGTMKRKFAILRGIKGRQTRDPYGGVPGPMLSSEGGAVPPEPKMEVGHLSASEVREAGRDPEVAAIAPVMPLKLIHPFECPTVAAANKSWGIVEIGADQSPWTGDGVVVAVLDTGIDACHPAFQGMSIVEQDFSGSGNGDKQGHGTHCAGTIFGRDVAGTRIGIARGVKKALIGKVLGDDGGGDSDSLFQGMQWAVNGGAKVVSMSLGFDFPGMVSGLVAQGWPPDLATSLALEAYRANLRMFDAIMEMLRARLPLDGGTVVVAAAGNESRRDVNPDYEIAASLPAAADGVIAVGAVERTDAGLQVASFSNTLPQVSAPGVAIESAKVGGGLRALSGTSMACPHVAGVATLWWQTVRNQATLATAPMVVAKVLATTRTNGFAQGVQVADRGAGIVTSPT